MTSTSSSKSKSPFWKGNPESIYPMKLLKSIVVATAFVCISQPAFPQEQPVDVAAIVDPVAAAAANFSPTRMIGMRPGEKRPLILKSNERNPYANRSPEKDAVNEEGENAEEIQIRERLNSLSVTGRSRGPNGLRLLLGDIILEPGRVLPELLEDQSESLKVVEVNEESLLLAWLDIETGEPTGKTMSIIYDLSPSISYALHGQSGADRELGIDSKPLMGVMKIGQDRKKQETQMAEKDPAQKLPREVYAAGQ